MCFLLLKSCCIPQQVSNVSLSVINALQQTLDMIFIVGVKSWAWGSNSCQYCSLSFIYLFFEDLNISSQPPILYRDGAWFFKSFPTDTNAVLGFWLYTWNHFCILITTVVFPGSRLFHAWFKMLTSHILVYEIYDDMPVLGIHFLGNIWHLYCSILLMIPWMIAELSAYWANGQWFESHQYLENEIKEIN